MLGKLTKTWNGYNLSRLVSGVISIQRRAARRAETVNNPDVIFDLIKWENEHTKYYLMTFGTDIDEFTSEVERRTSREFAERLHSGYVAARLDYRRSA